MMKWLTILLAGFLSVGCAGGDAPGTDVDSGGSVIREEGPGGKGPGGDAGATDGGDEAPDLSGCPEGACAVGETRCEGAGVERCQSDPDNPGCGVWTFSDCDGPGQTCVDGSCQIPTGCVDNDGDGYGSQCDPGSDCDDADDTVYEGADELCDGVDNDCDDDIDEDFQVGMPCTVGDGECQADGFLACAADGSGTMCDAMPTGDPEVCDGEDNDCDGTIDNGVCDLCDSDAFEPNDSEADATELNPGQPKWGYLCPGDVDWFELLPADGQDYRIYVEFPESLSDLLVEGYVNSSHVVTGDTAGQDWEVFLVTGDAADTFHIQVVNREPVESFFRVMLVPESQVSCDYEDGFAPNQTRATAAQFPPGWVTTAYMCSGYLSDWYATGDLVAGDTVEVLVEGLDIFGTDLDLHLWGDPDGDGTYQDVARSAGFGDFEQISTTISADGDYYIEVRDFDGAGGNYDVEWTLN
jgi:hypothetical protein